MASVFIFASKSNVNCGKSIMNSELDRAIEADYGWLLEQNITSHDAITFTLAVKYHYQNDCSLEYVTKVLDKYKK